MNTLIIVQARMTSTRLPGKVMRRVLGKPLLAYLIERLRRVRLADAIIVAMPEDRRSRPMIDLCNALAIPFFLGSEKDVLGRFYGAGLCYRGETIVRITADCPLLDPDVVDLTLGFFRDAHGRYDYVANWSYDLSTHTALHTFPLGMSVEVFTFKALSEAHRRATYAPEREHVTPFFYTHPEQYAIGHIDQSENMGHYRWTVDTPEDFELVRRIIEALYPSAPEFCRQDVLSLLSHHPDWSMLNAHIPPPSLNRESGQVP